uniref:Uncharacterized protein n=1 Tax=Vespula pensylvanica TaxID=30213 RepID=A0A834P136_VESPE|nr:hypothetical protein H0235_009092 [Vespula pensylvanica]
MLQAPLMSILMTHVEQSPTHVEVQMDYPTERITSIIIRDSSREEEPGRCEKLDLKLVQIGAVVMSRPNRHGGSREIDVEEPGETDYRPAILGFRTDLEPTASPLAWPATMRIEALSALVAAGYNEHKLPPVESIISILSSCLIRLAGVALQTLERTFTDRAVNLELLTTEIRGSRETRAERKFVRSASLPRIYREDDFFVLSLSNKFHAEQFTKPSSLYLERTIDQSLFMVIEKELAHRSRKYGLQFAKWTSYKSGKKVAYSNEPSRNNIDTDLKL